MLQKVPKDGSSDADRSPSPSNTLFATVASRMVRSPSSPRPKTKSEKNSSWRNESETDVRKAAARAAANAVIEGLPRRRGADHRHAPECELERACSRSPDGSRSAEAQQEEEEPEVTRKAPVTGRRKRRRRHSSANREKDGATSTAGRSASPAAPTPRSARDSASSASGSVRKGDKCKSTDDALQTEEDNKKKHKQKHEGKLRKGRGRDKKNKNKKHRSRSRSSSGRCRRRLRHKRKRRKSSSYSASSSQRRRRKGKNRKRSRSRRRSRKRDKRPSKRDKRARSRRRDRDRGSEKRRSKRSRSRTRDSERRKRGSKDMEKNFAWQQHMAWQMAQARGPHAAISWLHAQHAQHAWQAGMMPPPNLPPHMMPPPGLMPPMGPPGMLPSPGVPGMGPPAPGVLGVTGMPPNMLALKNTDKENSSDSSSDSGDGSSSDSGVPASGKNAKEGAENGSIGEPGAGGEDNHNGTHASKSGVTDEGNEGTTANVNGTPSKLDSQVERHAAKSGSERSKSSSSSSSSSSSRRSPSGRRKRTSGSKSGAASPTASQGPAVAASSPVLQQPIVTSVTTLALPMMGATPSDVEAFLQINAVDPDAAMRLRGLPPHLQHRVLERGDLRHTRNPSAVLIARVRDAESGVLAQDGLGQPAPPPAGDCHAGIEAMISRYNLDARAAGVLRSLPKHKQDLASQIDLTDARRPSAFIMAQLTQTAKFLDDGPPLSGLLPGSLDSQL